jgi:hypothetical protein
LGTALVTLQLIFSISGVCGLIYHRTIHGLLVFRARREHAKQAALLK